jgi:NAD(P)-dependent dehydrogenase (short-subunit alcohol dehydrogenase family)
VSDEESVAAMVKATVDTFGRLDMALNNAGIQVPPSDAADEPAEVFDRVNAINLRGVWACMKHELGQMRTPRGAAPSSTAPPSAVSSDSRVGLRTTRPSTA